MMLDAEQQETLLRVAEDAIRFGLVHGRPQRLDLAGYDAALRRNGASFVTLHSRGGLRGCIGSLQARRPLVEDVSENAFAAAFRDPRFPPLSRAEWNGLELEVSVLGPAEPIPAASEEALLDELRPGVDGLILEEHGHRATFLPAVWQSLPAPREFVRQLKLKAGLSPDYWSDTLRFSRYRTHAFGRPVAERTEVTSLRED